MSSSEIKFLAQIIKKYGGSEENILETEAVYLVNASPHELRFQDGTVLKGSTELAKILKATPKEKPILSIKPNTTLVQTEFIPEEEGLRFVEEIRAFNKTSKKMALIVSSIIAVNTYKFPVVSPITTPETSRLPPNQRIVYKNKFNTVLQ